MPREMMRCVRSWSKRDIRPIAEKQTSVWDGSLAVRQQPTSRANVTNTLHRYSDHYAFERIPNPEPVQDDYIVFAMSSRGINDDNLVEKYRTFLSIALKHEPVNIG